MDRDESSILSVKVSVRGYSVKVSVSVFQTDGESSNLSTRTMAFKDKNKQRAYNREWVKKRRTEYLKDKICALCNSKTDLEIDHIVPSTKISHKIWSWSQQRRDEELKKCQILCKACHRKKTNTSMCKEITHGTAGGYDRNCRCTKCKAWQSNRMKLYKERISLHEER